MEEFLLSSARHAWPFCLGAVVMATVLLQVRERLGMRAVFAVSVLLLLVLTVLSFFGEHNSWVKQHRPLLQTFVNFISVLGPIAALMPFLWFLPKVRRAVVRYGALVAAALVIVFFWPLWALVVTCSSGLDCL